VYFSSMGQTSQHQDYILIKGIQEGDSKIIRQVYTDYFNRIQVFIENNSGKENDALDIFQDALMVIYQKSKDPDFKLSSTLYTYLFAICKNLWFKQLKKKSNSERTIPDEKVLIDKERIIEAINERDRYQLYRKKFQKLSADCQQILMLFFEGQSMRKIAELMNISEKYARKRKFNCKEKLIDAVKKDHLYHELKGYGL